MIALSLCWKKITFAECVVTRHRKVRRRRKKISNLTLRAPQHWGAPSWLTNTVLLAVPVAVYSVCKIRNMLEEKLKRSDKLSETERLVDLRHSRHRQIKFQRCQNPCPMSMNCPFYTDLDPCSWFPALVTTHNSAISGENRCSWWNKNNLPQANKNTIATFIYSVILRMPYTE